MARFEPEFLQLAPKFSPADSQLPSDRDSNYVELPLRLSSDPPVAPPVEAGDIIPPLPQQKLPPEPRDSLSQEELSEAEEAELIDNQAEEILDNTAVPAGDLLESVDGLEDRGIAGEGVGQSDPEAAEENPGELCAGQGAVDCAPDAGTGEAGPAETDATGLPTNDESEEGKSPESEQPANEHPKSEQPESEPPEPTSAEDALEVQEVNAEEFDSEAFEAEEFDFDEEFLEESELGADSDADADLDPNTSSTSADEAAPEGDPDLGVLRLRPRPLVKQKSSLTIPVFLVGNVGYIANGNTLAGIDPVNDRLFRSGLSLIASPRLSKRTALIASVQGNFYRYDELSRLNYNELRLQTSLRHVMTQRVYGDVGWTHRQLFLQDSGDRFLYEHAAFANLTRRDPITKKTGLTSFYNFRVGFADPETSSRLRNTLGVSLRHDLTPSLQASVTSRMTLTNFTQQSRQDFYIQGLAQLSYRVSKHVRLSTFASLTRGNSSNRRVDFDNSTVGISLSGNVKLF